MSASPSLAWLLRPMTVDAFVAEVWGRRAGLIRRGHAGDFSELLNVSDIENLLQHGRTNKDAVRIVLRDEGRPVEDYRLANGAIDLVRIRNLLAEGHTLVLNGLERYLSAIGTLAHAIEVELNFETQVNAYITPPNSQGFRAHYDDHDVLIVQVEGSKVWDLYGPETDVPPHGLPLREQFSTDALPRPRELHLRAGDVLYLPAGRVHAATAQEETSIHLTLGIHAPTVMALITKMFESLCLRDDRLLGQLPPRYLTDASTRASLGRIAQDAFQAVDQTALSEALGALEDALLRRGRCASAGRLISDVIDNTEVGLRTWVKKSKPLYSRVLTLNKGVALQFSHSLVPAGAGHRGAMLFLSRSTEAFRVGDIPELSELEQIELARKLLVDGFLLRQAET